MASRRQSTLPPTICGALVRGPLEWQIRVGERTPHMGGRTVVVAQALLGLLEVTGDDLLERLDLHDRLGIEGIQIIDCHSARRTIPFMRASKFVGGLNMG